MRIRAAIADIYGRFISRLRPQVPEEPEVCQEAQPHQGPDCQEGLKECIKGLAPPHSSLEEGPKMAANIIC